MRGIVIAGTHSGCGKTTVTLGILAALRKKGLAVQPFKAGPDFIDAGLHRLAVDRPSRNLDQWMCGPEYVVECFRRNAAGADIAVVEGVMGMYDGDSSTAALAALLQVPVILVVDAYGMAESAGAMVRGFAEYGMPPIGSFEGRPHAECGIGTVKAELCTPNSALKFAGVIFNRVASENHYKRLKDSVRDVPVLGYLPRELNFEIPHRHLGLSIAEENPIAGENIQRLADAVLAHIDVEQIIKTAQSSMHDPVEGRHSRLSGIVVPDRVLPRNDSGQAGMTSKVTYPKNKRFILAVAYDKAFSFYYEDNLDLMRDAGAEILRFSPLVDRTVPTRADAVYIGGGYPELHADALSRNRSMLESIHAWAGAGKPLYAECGGLMYLSKGIRDFDDRFFAMAGVFPFETRMTKKPRLGYREILLKEDCLIGARGDRYRGHEFHYSEILEGATGQVYSLSDSRGKVLPAEGFRSKNTLASYVHVHFGSNPHIAEQFATYVKGERIP